jgi:cytochrome b6-f complex iron-sulfur subunit
MSKITRRDFLKFTTDGLLTLSGLLGLGGLIRFLSYDLDPAPPVEYDLGPVENFPLGSRNVLPHVPAVLIHNDEGFTALSFVCTHLGCTVSEKGTTFECPCHGSAYDDTGFVQKGPAKNPLKRLRVTTTGSGNLLLHMT